MEDNQRELACLARMLELSEAGLGLRRIAAALNTEGWKARKPEGWSRWSVATALRQLREDRDSGGDRLTRARAQLKRLRLLGVTPPRPAGEGDA